MKRRFGLLALVLAVIALLGGTVLEREHNLQKSYNDETRRLWTMIATEDQKVRDYVCDGIDGIDCHVVMAAFRRHGLQAAIDKRTEILRYRPFALLR